MNFLLSNSKFTFYLSNDILPDFQKFIDITSDNSVISATTKTDIIQAQKGDRQVLVIGLCIDSQGKLSRQEIPMFLLESMAQNDNLIFEAAKGLAGNYVVLCYDKSRKFLFTDAIGAMSVFYTKKGNRVICSTQEGLLARELKLSPDDSLLKIRQSSELFEQMPYDSTIYAEIKCLLPNHVLDLASGRALRYWPDNKQASKRKYFKAETVTEESVKIIDGIVKEYAKHYSLSVALTGGVDSRTVFSAVKDSVSDVEYFTFKHRKLSEKSGDIIIPSKLSADYSIKHTFVEVEPVPDVFFDDFTKVSGNYVSRDTVTLAYNYLSHFDDRALINGNIIEQIARNMIGQDGPSWTFPSLQIADAMNNNSTEAIHLCKQQVKSIKKVELGSYMYDLLSWESRCGRAVSQGSAVYALAGITFLNIFNCRRLIELWTSVDQTERKKGLVNEELIKAFDSTLLSYPINPDRKPIARIKKSWQYHVFAILYHRAKNLLNSRGVK